MKRYRKFVAAGILGSVLVVPALAQQHRSHFPFEFSQIGVSKLKDFGVTDDQIRQMGQIFEANRNTLAGLQADVTKRENDLTVLLRNSQVDAVEAERMTDALIDARGKLAKATTMMMVRMREVLTLDQWEKLSEYHESLAAAGSSHSHAPPVPPPPLSPGVYGAGGDVSAPQAIYKVVPTYTHAAKDAKIQGSVALYVVVDTDGTPRDVRVARSLDPELDQKAIEAVSQWKFKPGTKAGQPVPVAATIEINFSLK